MMESRFRNHLSAICAYRENIALLWLFSLTKQRATAKSAYAFLRSGSNSLSAPLGRAQRLISPVPRSR